MIPKKETPSGAKSGATSGLKMDDKEEPSPKSIPVKCRQTPDSCPGSEDGGLVVPKKAINPCTDSQERKDLHKELLFNQKIGKNVLGQKSELKKALEKRLEGQKRKEQGKNSRRNSFERKLEEQALKLEKEEEERQDKTSDPQQESEFLRIHAKLRAHSGPQKGSESPKSGPKPINASDNAVLCVNTSS